MIMAILMFIGIISAIFKTFDKLLERIELFKNINGDLISNITVYPMD
jgi:hypothetical protein